MIHSQLVITDYDNKICSFLICDNQLEDLHVSQNDSLLNHIYVGKVKNISKNIDAAFVEIKDGKMGFLSLKGQRQTIREGDELLVQVIKEGVKTKDPVLTTDLSLHGRYAVISMKQGQAPIQYSKKLDVAIKERLSQAFVGFTSPYGVIVRTSAKAAPDTSVILDEIGQLSAKLDKIITNGKMRTCFSCLYESSPEYLEYVCKLQPDKYEEIVTDTTSVYELLDTYQLPVRYYADDYSLKKLYSLDHRIEELLCKKVYLKSGATLFIEPTEALTVIDVNTGKCVFNKDKDELILKINLEAAEEIAKQLRLRNISGIIIIDFINMKKKEYMDTLIKEMKNLIKHDLVSCSFVDVTGLGLMELTRKKVQRPLNELFHR